MITEKEIETALKKNKEKRLKKAVEKTLYVISCYILLSLFVMLFCLFIPYITQKLIGLDIEVNFLFYLGGIIFIAIYYFIVNNIILASFLKSGNMELKLKLVKKLAKIDLEKEDEQFILDEFFLQARVTYGF